MPRTGGHMELHKVGRRFNWWCVYCGCLTHCQGCNPELPPTTAATRDHIVPRNAGGKTHANNLVLACSACNGMKGHRELDLDEVQELTLTASLTARRRGPRPRGADRMSPNRRRTL